MQSQNFEVGEPEPGTLNGGKDLRKSWNVTTGKDVLSDPGIRHVWSTHAAYATDQSYAAIRQQRCDRVEELPIIGNADMLKHPNRDDSVELALDRPIIAKLELRAAC